MAAREVSAPVLRRFLGGAYAIQFELTSFVLITSLALLCACGGGGAPSSSSSSSSLPAPSSLSYSQNSVQATVGQAISLLTPTVIGTVASYVVNPTLPAGLSLNSSTGVISGTPTTVTAAASYVVTASNASGSTSATLQVTVNPAPPSALIYSETTVQATVGQAVTLTCTVTGTVTSYTVSPALPAGLSLNSSTGAISGTPSAVTATANYVVTASNAGGATTAILQIAVNAAPPSNLAYPQTTVLGFVGQALTPLAPTVTGTVDAYSVNPALPAGLSLNSSTGVISGTPLVAAPQAGYVVTAANSLGSSSATLQITVNPPCLTYPQTTIQATVGQAITPLSPAVTGTVTSYVVNPALPLGFSLDYQTGVISGTPTIDYPEASYAVTARSPSTSCSVTLQIVVYSVLPYAYYPVHSIVARVGLRITPDIPALSAPGASFAVTPALPAGLTLDTSTGIISGTPTAASPKTQYKITSAGDSAFVYVDITVINVVRVLLDLGHDVRVDELRMAGSRVLSSDLFGRWVLWNYDTAEIVASGDGAGKGAVDMAGSTVVIAIPNGLEVRSADDGHLISMIVAPGVKVGPYRSSQYPEMVKIPWWKLAQDGSYVCVGSDTGLWAWASTGQLLFSRAGDYSMAKVFAAPSQLQIGLGPAGQNVAETISIADGTSSQTAPFFGQFHSWFLDGERFLTNLSTTVWTYSKSGVQESIVQLPTVTHLTGQGNWLWTLDSIYDAANAGYPLAIYALGDSAPTTTWYVNYGGGGLFPSSSTLGVLGIAAVSVVDFSGAMPAKIDYQLPFGNQSTFGATSASKWLAGNDYGMILDGTSLSGERRYFGFGRVWDIAGSDIRVAVATTVGKVFYFDPGFEVPVSALNVTASRIALSSDATVLAARTDLYDDTTLNIFSMPSGTIINSFPSRYSVLPWISEITLSKSGATMGQVLQDTGGSYVRKVLPTMGGPVIWSDTGFNGSAPQLSPDGTLAAISGNGATNIYKNGVLMVAIPGTAVGWLDNDRLLAGGGIYSSAGIKLGSVKFVDDLLLEAYGVLLEVAGPDLVYSAYANRLLSVSTGQALWTSPRPVPDIETVGAVSGPFVVFVWQGQVLVDAY